jgi:hypothetical protein
MTRARLQIRDRPAQPGFRAFAPRPPSCLSPAVGPSAPADVKRPEAPLLGMLGNSGPLLPSPDRRPVLNCGTEQPGWHHLNRPEFLEALPVIRPVPATMRLTS